MYLFRVLVLVLALISASVCSYSKQRSTRCSKAFPRGQGRCVSKHRPCPYGTVVYRRYSNHQFCSRTGLVCCGSPWHSGTTKRPRTRPKLGQVTRRPPVRMRTRLSHTHPTMRPHKRSTMQPRTRSTMQPRTRPTTRPHTRPHIRPTITPAPRRPTRRPPTQGPRPGPTPDPSLRTCGRGSPLASDRIFNGAITGPCDWPWVVSIRTLLKDETQLSYNTTVHACAGVLIDPRWVLTTPFCVLAAGGTTEDAPNRFFVVAGEYNVSRIDTYPIDGLPQEQTLLVERAILHPRYRYRNLDQILFDNPRAINGNGVALLQLRQAISPRCAGVVCLPSLPEVTDMCVNYDECVITGWGLGAPPSQGLENNDVLKLGRVRLSSFKACDFVTNLWRSTNQRPAGTVCQAPITRNAGPCLGDEGGAVMCSSDGRWVVRGLIPFNMCIKNDFNLYVTSLAPYLPWVKATMARFTSNDTWNNLENNNTNKNKKNNNSINNNNDDDEDNRLKNNSKSLDNNNNRNTGKDYQDVEEDDDKDNDYDHDHENFNDYDDDEDASMMMDDGDEDYHDYDEDNMTMDEDESMMDDNYDDEDAYGDD